MDYSGFYRAGKTSPAGRRKKRQSRRIDQAGMRVPPGFAVTTDSYLNFITEAGIRMTSSIWPTESQAGEPSMPSGQVQELVNASSPGNLSGHPELFAVV